MGKRTTHRTRGATVRRSAEVLPACLPGPARKRASKGDVQEPPVAIELVTGRDVNTAFLLQESTNDFIDAAHGDRDRCRQIITRATVVSRSIVPLLERHQKYGVEHIAHSDRLLAERCRVCTLLDLPFLNAVNLALRSGDSKESLTKQIVALYPEEEAGTWERALDVHFRGRHYRKETKQVQNPMSEGVHK